MLSFIYFLVSLIFLSAAREFGICDYHEALLRNLGRQLPVPRFLLFLMHVKPEINAAEDAEKEQRLNEEERASTAVIQKCPGCLRSTIEFCGCSRVRCTVCK
jgi:hypothetical protein